MLSKWIQSLAVSFACAAGLTSCGGSSIDVSTATRQCANGFNPAVTVNVNVKSFTVDQSSGHLDQTGFKQFFAAIQPNQTQQSGSPDVSLAQQAADGIGALSQQFVNYQPSDAYNNYKSVRNAPDFINNEIGTDDIGNFDTGRQHIVACIGQQAAAGYDNGGVTLNDLSTATGADGAGSKAWTFIVRWNYSPAPTGGSANVTRVIEGLNTNSSLISIYDPQSFSAVGFNQPESIIYGFTEAGYGYANAKAQLTFNLTKEFVGSSNEDDWEMASESTDASLSPDQQKTAPSPLPYEAFMNSDHNVRCVRLVMHYDSNEADLYYSDNAPTLDTSSNTNKGAYAGSCLDSSAQPKLVYTTNSTHYPER